MGRVNYKQFSVLEEKITDFSVHYYFSPCLSCDIGLGWNKMLLSQKPHAWRQAFIISEGFCASCQGRKHHIFLPGTKTDMWFPSEKEILKDSVVEFMACE